MGYGTSDTARVHARTQSRHGASAQQVFQQEREAQLHPSLDPRGLIVRESRDSEEHPESLAVAFMMDITGSMAGIPVTLATQTMHEFMPGLASINPHVQVLFGAVGDADDGTRSAAPWQIGQFETDDEKADQCLTRLWLSGSGGSAPYESYDLAFFFAARLTGMDCLEKRQRKGHLFLVGDDICRQEVNARTVNRLLGREELLEDIPIQRIIQEAAQKYHIFFLIPDLGRAQSERDGQLVGEHWKRLLGENGTAIVLEKPEDTAVVCSVLFDLTEGAYLSVAKICDVLTSAPFNIYDTKRIKGILEAVSEYALSLGIQVNHERSARRVG